MCYHITARLRYKTTSSFDVVFDHVGGKKSVLALEIVVLCSKSKWDLHRGKFQPILLYHLCMAWSKCDCRIVCSGKLQKHSYTAPPLNSDVGKVLGDGVPKAVWLSSKHFYWTPLASAYLAFSSWCIFSLSFFRDFLVNRNLETGFSFQPST